MMRLSAWKLVYGLLVLCTVTANALPFITLSKKSGPPTSQILVSGRGFEPNVGVDIYFDTKDETLVVTDNKGEFRNAKAHVPRRAHPGKHWVTALEQNNDKGAQQAFVVDTNWSQFHFDADGTRLNPYENVLNPNTVANLGLKWIYTTGEFVFLSSPAVVGDVLYVNSGNDTVYALDVRTGSKVWSHNTKTFVEDGSPAVANGLVYVGTGNLPGDGGFDALRADTGDLLWTYPTYVGTEESSPAVSDGVVYLGSVVGNVYALDARTGDQRWSYNTGKCICSSPAVVNGTVYVGSGQSVIALDASTGAELWIYTTGGDIFRSSPAVSNGVVYIGSDDNNLYALNASTGTKLWNYATGAQVYSSPAVADGRVYVGSEDNNLYALDANTGAKLWSYSTGDFVESSPAVANGVVYVGSADTNVYALDAHTGMTLWTYTTGGVVQSSPTVVNGVLYIGSNDDNVYAFGLTANGAENRGNPVRPSLNTLRPDLSLKVSSGTRKPPHQ